ncbi:MAG: ribosome biogenesis GTP-binding protein YihA/YsxC [Clostridiales bacterium]|nr:ribosome biogenesis GTP-binding protein YihA/YsxC [Clostridiales bacterium]
MNLQNVSFVKSAVRPSDFVRDGRPSIVFAGKSNVGKSSTINRLLGRKNFARVGSQPGKTVHINYFLVDGTAWFIDLPGYGYAKVAKAERDRWGRLMDTYFSEPELTTLGVMIVDSRHAPTGDDVTMSQWFLQTGCPLVIVANKCDKLKKSELEPNLACIRKTLSLPEAVEIIPFSAEKGDGKTRLLEVILSYT